MMGNFFDMYTHSKFIEAQPYFNYLDLKDKKLTQTKSEVILNLDRGNLNKEEDKIGR